MIKNIFKINLVVFKKYRYAFILYFFIHPISKKKITLTFCIFPSYKDKQGHWNTGKIKYFDIWKNKNAGSGVEAEHGEL